MNEFSSDESGSISQGNCHLTIGSLLKELLTPRGVTVETEYPIRVKVDIVLTNERGEWSEEQKRFLPDGIRDCKAKLVAIEVKCTQSVNEASLFQAEKYDSLLKDRKPSSRKGSSREEKVFYRKEDIRTFLLSARTPEDQRLREFGFTIEDSEGVLWSTQEKYKDINLIVLNKLPNVLHNAAVKCLCTEEKEREGAIALLKTVYRELSIDTRKMIDGLSRIGGDEIMLLEATPENLKKWGEEWGELYLSCLPVEKRLKGIPVEDRLKDIPVDEVLKDIPVDEVLKDIPVETRLKDVPVNEVLKDIPVDELRKFLEEKST